MKVDQSAQGVGDYLQPDKETDIGYFTFFPKEGDCRKMGDPRHSISDNKKSNKLPTLKRDNINFNNS
jgi:hypothetical protein